MNKNQLKTQLMHTILEGEEDGHGSTWHQLSAFMSWAFLVTEVGELGDQLIRQGHTPDKELSRHRPNIGRDDHDAMMEEFGDVLLMLCTTANRVGIDLDKALTFTIDEIHERFSKEV